MSPLTISTLLSLHYPQLMINGGWTETIYIDEKAKEAQRLAIERILTGQEGGPW